MSGATTEERYLAGRRRLLAGVLVLAAALRLLHWAAVRQEPFVASLVMDSEVYDRWAQEIVAGDWLGREAFFQAPFYPYFLAAVYALGGRSLDLVYLLQIATAVLGCFALYRAGTLMVGQRAGLSAALLMAVYGPFLFHDVQLLKESLAVSAVCLLLWALAAARQEPPAGRSAAAVAGLLCGILVLLRENALLVAPVLPLVIVIPWRGARRAAALAVLFCLGFALVLSPVTLRNRWVAGEWLPTTFQGGVNFYIGNNPHADGTYRPIVPGKQVPLYERREPVRLAEQEVGRRLSPREVSRFWLARSLDWARRQPGAFAALQLRKLGLFWSWYEWPDAVDYYDLRGRSWVLRLPLLEFGGITLLAAVGIWLGRRRLAALLPALVLGLAWCLSTVAFFLFSRYRLPAIPALLVPAGLTVAALAEFLESRRWGRAAGLALLCGAALALPRVAGYGARQDLVHYNLGRILEQRGDREEAAAEYRLALEANPEMLLACLNLGNHAARDGELAAAERWYRRALEIEPLSDDAWSNLGGTLLALGDLEGAQASLERALELNPRSIWALHNRALLAERRGDSERARDLNSRVLELDPGHAPARRLKARLEGGGSAQP